MDRRLSAIMAADVVGYSRLMGQDEGGTLTALKAHRAEFTDPAIAGHRGRIVKLMGDGVLVEFASVVDALECAVILQRGMAERNADTPQDRRIEFRIGINLGDIIVDGDDIYGNSVNVAARLEALAEPGGICLSGRVLEQVEKNVDVGFASLGSQTVKNIEKPVNVYKVLLDPDDAGQVVGEPKRSAPRSSKRVALAAALAVLIAVAGAVAWLKPWEPALEVASVERMALPLPDKPSIAVLPFTNISDDPAQEYFADGMTEDLITDLSKISGLFVIARNSSFSYKGQQVKVRRVAEDLGVRYVLEGSVRRVGEHVRVNAQLIDATTGGHVWAERYDRRLDNIFAVQDAIAERVVEALELHLTYSERKQRDEGPKTTNLEAYDLVLKARELMTRFDHSAAVEARDLLQRAIELDPAYGEAHSVLGLYYFDEWRLWGLDRENNLARALELARKAVELSPLDPAPHVLLAQVHQFRREFEAANAEADAAFALGPKDAITLANLGSMLRYAHRSEEAAEVVERAIRLDPYHPPNYLEWLSDAYFLLGRYEECVQAANRGVALNPDFVPMHVLLAECHAALGNEEEARAAASEILRANPHFTLTAFASYVPFSDTGDLHMKTEMLRRAGVPQ